MKTNRLLVVAALFSVACSHKTIKMGPDNVVSQSGVASVWATWVKDKKDKFDMNLNIRNESEKGMIIFLSDMGCKRGGIPGKLKHTFFNTGERTIDFKPNQTKDFNVVCNTGSEQKGDFEISINKIYLNDPLDGKTPGKILGQNLIWKKAQE